MKLYLQTDQNWANKELGTGGDTIRMNGCFLCSQAMIAYDAGHNVNPSTLNDMFVEKDLYTNGQLLAFQSITSVFPDVKWLHDYSFESFGRMKDELAEHYIIFQVDSDSNPINGIQSHFIVAVEFKGNELYVNDPVFGYCRFLDHYKETAITRLGIYEKSKIDIAQYEGKVVEAPDGRAFAIINSEKCWSPDVATFYSCGYLVGEIIKVSDLTIDSIPNGPQLQFVGSKHQKMFQDMKNNGFVKY